MRRFLRAVTEGVLHLLAPSCCHVCGRLLGADEDRFCRACETAVFTDPDLTCPRCAATVGPFAVLADRCANCREESLPFARALRLGRYDGTLREVIVRLKHAQSEGLAELLGERWGRRLRVSLGALAVEVVVSVPLHWRRRWWRGYDQSAAVARGLASGLGLPCRPSWLRRVRDTPSQTTMPSPTARRENVKGAFVARRPGLVRGRAILLVDDVMTTGATVGEAARALRAGGATRIVVAVLARPGQGS